MLSVLLQLELLCAPVAMPPFTLGDEEPPLFQALLMEPFSGDTVRC